MEKEVDFSPEAIAKKYNINLKELELEQKKLAKNLKFKDEIDFSLADRIAGIESSFFKNKIISGIVLISSSLEVLEQQYFSDFLKFPYIPGFRAYRELPSMIAALNKLEETPDVVFINGHGLAHPRLGLASHFSILTGLPSIGVADSLIAGEVKGEDIILNDKKVGKVFQSKQGSRPLYVSPGNMISIKSALELTKRVMKEPHKFPEPLHLSARYTKETRRELFESDASAGN